MNKFIYVTLLSFLLGFAAQIPAVAQPVNDVEALSRFDEASGPIVKATAEGVELYSSAEASTTFMIYSITGQLVKKLTVTAGSHLSASLPGGCYIVRCSSWAKKVVVG